MLQLDLKLLESKLRKPLCPNWATQDSYTSRSNVNSRYSLVLCCTASRQDREDDISSPATYIQGAGDDSESWSHGLTAAAFWRNETMLLQCCTDSEIHLEPFIKKIMQQEHGLISPSQCSAIFPLKSPWPVYVGRLEAAYGPDSKAYDGIITCENTAGRVVGIEGCDPALPTYMQLKCRAGKLGSRDLRSQLPRIRSFISQVFSHCLHPKILIACASGEDFSVGVALAVISLYYDDEGMDYVCHLRTSAN